MYRNDFAFGEERSKDNETSELLWSVATLLPYTAETGTAIYDGENRKLAEALMAQNQLMLG